MPSNSLLFLVTNASPPGGDGRIDLVALEDDKYLHGQVMMLASLTEEVVKVLLQKPTLRLMVLFGLAFRGSMKAPMG